MTTYEPGTVATVTHRGDEGLLAVRSYTKGWVVFDRERSLLREYASDAAGQVTDVRPRRWVKPGEVVIEATREDADKLLTADYTTCTRIANAIREQTPEPRWTVEPVGHGSVWHRLCHDGANTDVQSYGHFGAETLQSIADTLNAAAGKADA